MNGNGKYNNYYINGQYFSEIEIPKIIPPKPIVSLHIDNCLEELAESKARMDTEIRFYSEVGRYFVKKAIVDNHDYSENINNPN
jgi:hypothetical protein